MTLRDTPREITIIFIEMCVFLSLVSIEFGDRNTSQYINDTSIAFSVSVSHSRSLSSLHVRRTHINRIFILMDKCETNSNPISSKRKNKYTNSIYAIVVLIKTKFFFVMEFSSLFYGWTEPCSDVVVVVVDVRYFSFTIWFIWFVLGIQCTNTYGAWTQWNRFNYFFFFCVTSDANQEASKNVVDFSRCLIFQMLNFFAMQTHFSTENYDCCREKCG